MGSSSLSSSRAVLWWVRPWKSMAIPKSGPTASRTACTFSNRPLTACASLIQPILSVPIILTLAKPWAFFSRAERAAISGVSESIQLYTAMRRRTAPPSSS